MSQVKHYDILVFIGRFSPFHGGHRRVVELALKQCRQLLVLVGSTNQPRTIKNPFTYDERRDMILQSLDPQHVSRMTIRPLKDSLYNDSAWIAQVQHNIDCLADTKNEYSVAQQPKIGIIGYEKDESSYYLKLFPQYDFIDVGRNYDDSIDATTIRQMWLSGQSPRFTTGVLNHTVHDFIYNKFPAKERSRLIREYEHITNYKKQWKHVPYPVTFVTTDAVVVQSGHVLVVERKSAPGEGLYALPGGFLSQNETIEDGVIRELKEETKIKVPEPALRGSIKTYRVFDAPNRSLRGRTITHAFLIELPPGKLPKVKGSDDAASAKWLQLTDFEHMEDMFFEDHHHIIKYMLGRI